MALAVVLRSRWSEGDQKSPYWLFLNAEAVLDSRGLQRLPSTLATCSPDGPRRIVIIHVGATYIGVLVVAKCDSDMTQYHERNCHDKVGVLVLVLGDIDGYSRR